MPICPWCLSLLGTLLFGSKQDWRSSSVTAFPCTFEGLKMIGDFAGVHVGTELSLAVVASVLGAGVGLSLALPDTDPDPRN